MQSLATFIDTLPKSEVLRLDESVPLDYVPTALVLELEKSKRSPALFLTHPEGSDMPIVANLFGDRGRIARIVGTTVADFNTAWSKILANLKPPCLVASGPVHERVFVDEEADAKDLPISRHFAQDAGGYVNAGILVCKDPDTGVRNLSFQRLQLKGPRRFATNLGSRGDIWHHLNRAAELDRNLEVAVVIGAHPAVYLAAAAKVGMDIDEYEIAGSILGAPLELVKCQTIDVEVPAHAEMVIEGELLSKDHEDEGPYGEYTGYASGRSTRNVFVVKAITRRSKPIYLDIINGFSAEHTLLGNIAKEALIFQRLKEMVPGVKALNYPKSGAQYHAYLSLNVAAEGEARRALTLLLGLDHYVKLAVAVDGDIDVFDEGEVHWAIATRFQADTDLFIVPKVLCNRIDPSSIDGMSAKMAIDATRPRGFEAERATVPADAIDLARTLIV